MLVVVAMACMIIVTIVISFFYSFDFAFAYYVLCHVLRVCCMWREPWSDAAGCRCCGHYTTIFDGKRDQCLYVSGFNASALTALMMPMWSVADTFFD